MEQPNPFRLSEVRLLEAYFKLHIAENEAFPEREPLLVRPSHSIDGTLLKVNLEVDVWRVVEDQRAAEAKVIMGGEFELAEGLEANLVDNFSEINAPAILYPFIRETIASLTTRAGIPTVLVQPLSFIDMAQRRQQRLAEELAQSQVQEDNSNNEAGAQS